MTSVSVASAAPPRPNLHIRTPAEAHRTTTLRKRRNQRIHHTPSPVGEDPRAADDSDSDDSVVAWAPPHVIAEYSGATASHSVAKQRVMREQLDSVLDRLAAAVTLAARRRRQRTWTRQFLCRQ